MFYKENFLTYPSVPDDQIVVELTIGNWNERAIWLEREALNTHGQALFYFIRKLVDDVMCGIACAWSPHPLRKAGGIRAAIDMILTGVN